MTKKWGSVRKLLVLWSFGHVSRSQRQILTNERLGWGVGRRPARRHAPRARWRKRKIRQCGYVTPHCKNFSTLPKPQKYEKIWFLVVEKPKFAPNLGQTSKKHILGLGQVSIFENFRGPFCDNVIFKDENNLWSNWGLKTKARDLNFTLVRFWILLAVKCPLESISKPYGRATAMPTAWGLIDGVRGRKPHSIYRESGEGEV